MKRKVLTTIVFSWVFTIIGFAQLPEASFTYQGSCQGSIISFTNTSNTTNVLWDFGDGIDTRKEHPQHIYAADGQYTITLTAYLNDRTDVYTEVIEIFPNPDISLSYSREAIEDTVRMWTGQTVEVQVSESYPDYQWQIKNDGNWSNTGDGQSSYTTPTAGDYQVVVTTTEGCSNSKPFVIITQPYPVDDDKTRIIFLNNVLTPNNDGINDALMVKNLMEATIYTEPLRLLIYNKQGVLVYENNEYANDWIGTDNGNNLLSTGTYYYVASSKGRRGETGYVNIIRSE